MSNCFISNCLGANLIDPKNLMKKKPMKNVSAEKIWGKTKQFGHFLTVETTDIEIFLIFLGSEKLIFNGFLSQ